MVKGKLRFYKKEEILLFTAETYELIVVGLLTAIVTAGFYLGGGLYFHLQDNTEIHFYLYAAMVFLVMVPAAFVRRKEHRIFVQSLGESSLPLQGIILHLVIVFLAIDGKVVNALGFQGQMESYQEIFTLAVFSLPVTIFWHFWMKMLLVFFLRLITGINPNLAHCREDFITELSHEFYKCKRYNTVFSLILFSIHAKDPKKKPGTRLSIKVSQKILKYLNQSIRQSDQLGYLEHGKIAGLMTFAATGGAKSFTRRIHEEIAKDKALAALLAAKNLGIRHSITEYSEKYENSNIILSKAYEMLDLP